MKKKGISFIEILMVMVIIILLLGVISLGSKDQMEKRKLKNAKNIVTETLRKELSDILDEGGTVDEDTIIKYEDKDGDGTEELIIQGKVVELPNKVRVKDNEGVIVLSIGENETRYEVDLIHKEKSDIYMVETYEK